ncbi:MAG: tyrosine--tRNA ligase [Candidatus Cloacimonadaceae bacterium]|jgi:tyrosyl-tRNA synthetase|nr:tyrosine--tRNA ligase [Candidatus Cloacimonadota bacterium]MDY0127311.1 tyrosine--tRNA ligase [Candidatus Cloacimonadaceae bacterium]MCB5254176.1 tyrosine--tRNA ligase [Candidatus Cloacimonadota bacterium]MCK9178769.1 tyrosine--tRNA ligase [Candidatus Cloacimonadota bacterium]MCK9242548.1 tyrosine--tRNA ligase [Candidatus Cloacimonadota bacterium]
MAFEQELKIISKNVEEIIPLDELKAKLADSKKTGKPLRIKYGIDPTGYDVHIGHLVPIRKMREFQDLGHTGVIIIGDFTAQIGDPTGRDESRPPLSHEQIISNSEKYMEQLFTILIPEQTEIRYQTEWFGKMSLENVLKLMGKFTLAQFMAHDSFRSRYEQGLSLGMHELMYPLLQAYDSVAVESDVELGATEQKFNILCGRDMQRYFDMPQQIAVLSPILLGTDGVNKMGKSLNNYIAVFDTPADKFGKVMSIPDSLIMNYYSYATTYEESQLAEVKARLDSGENPMILKKALAREIVKLYHGQEEAETAQEGFESLFSKKEIPEDIPEYIVEDHQIKIVQLLVQSGLCSSNGEAKRLIKGGGVSLDGEKVSDFEATITPAEGSVLRAGKRKFIKIKKL